MIDFFEERNNADPKIINSIHINRDAKRFTAEITSRGFSSYKLDKNEEENVIKYITKISSREHVLLIGMGSVWIPTILFGWYSFIMGDVVIEIFVHIVLSFFALIGFLILYIGIRMAINRKKTRETREKSIKDGRYSAYEIPIDDKGVIKNGIEGDEYYSDLYYVKSGEEFYGVAHSDYETITTGENAIVIAMEENARAVLFAWQEVYMKQTIKQKIIGQKDGQNYIVILPIMVGLIFMVIGVWSFIGEVVYWKSEPLSTTGVITEITVESSYDPGPEGGTTTTYRADVRYVIDGMEYTDTVSCSSKERVGDVISLYYIQGNPENVRFAGPGYTFGIIFFLLGGTLFSLMLVGLIKNIKEGGTSYKKIMKNGVEFSAIVLRAEKNMKVTIEKRNPQYLICEGTHPETGKPAEFETNSVMADLSRFVGQSVRVYMLDAEYHVDLRGLLDNA